MNNVSISFGRICIQPHVYQPSVKTFKINRDTAWIMTLIGVEATTGGNIFPLSGKTRTSGHINNLLL